MFFNSFHFVGFFMIVWAVTLVLRRRVPWRNAFLLAASYYFYGWWDWRFLGLIVLSTGVDYVCGRLLSLRAATDTPPRRSKRDRWVLTASVVTNLGILGSFKYFDFFSASAARALTALGLEADLPLMKVLLPVGISFYTFQTMSYTIDVYRGRITAERDPLAFALFVAFFPQLVAGPIERAGHLLPQFKNVRQMDWQRTYTGLYLIGCGLFKKVVIADNVAEVANWAFLTDTARQSTVASGGGLSGMATLMGVYAFAIQIYCDFSGYTDIARGAARCLGFDLMRNFNLPYFATNPSDFWRRWHISLSTWLRDYLYIALGGNRRGPARTYLNLMITMLLGGLWHGAAWTFVAWGAVHGLLLCAHRAIQPTLERWINPKHRVTAGLWYTVRAVVFFHLVCLGWLLFRADNIGHAWDMLSRLFTRFGYGMWNINGRLVTILVSSALFLLLVQLWQFRRNDMYVIFRLPTPVRAVAYACLILAFMWLGNYGGNAFIYFQF